MGMASPVPRHELRQHHCVFVAVLGNGGVEVRGNRICHGPWTWQSRSPPGVSARSITGMTYGG